MYYKRLIVLITIVIYTYKWIRCFHTRCDTHFYARTVLQRTEVRYYNLQKRKENKYLLFRLNNSVETVAYFFSLLLKLSDYFSRGAQIFQKSRSHLKRKGTRSAAQRKNCTKGWKIFSVTVKILVAMEFWDSGIRVSSD